jgi:aryl-alcohol dehydrogenase-like predicted oxidoreductase
MPINFKSPKIILGTANFGNHYGIANRDEYSKDKNITEIINTAVELGVTSFDTAKAYGEAEMILGYNIVGKDHLNVTTKIGKTDCGKTSQVISSIQKSLENTKLEKFSAVLLHDSSVLEGNYRNEVKNGLLELLKLGFCDRIGVSVYSEDEVIKTKKNFPELTEFQIPENICDQRKLTSPYLKELACSGNNITVRSIFLQGLLLMDANDVPKELNSAKERLTELKEFSELNAVSILDACIAYAKSIPWASGLVFGIDTTQQLRKIVSSFNQSLNLDANDAPRLDAWTLDPRNWS